MQIIEKRLEELIDYENNPRHNEAAVGKVAASIEEFGFKVPIVIDKDNVIIAGHTRRKAAESLGLLTVPCIVADDLTEEQVKAFRLADNKTSEFADWDFEKLNEELADLQGIDMAKFGFITDESNVNIDDFFTATEPKEKEPKKIQCPHCGEWFEA
jgi:site-specific DNA-methyltransferase (adenine-specific)